MQIKQFLIALLALLIFEKSSAQNTVSGKVTDARSGEAVPYASVACMKTGTGTITDFDGTFRFESSGGSGILIVSSIGYQPDTLKITDGNFQNLSIQIIPVETNIDEVVVYAGKNPAHVLLKKMIKARKQNNPEKYDSYSYEQYTKAKLSINNLSDSINKDQIKPPFRVLYDVIDSSEHTGKKILPIMLSESLSDFYYKRFPKRQKEIVKAVKFAGFEDDNLGKYTGQMYVINNFYRNYIELFEKQFVSPLNAAALVTYEYYLTDSAYIDDRWCYRMKFKPRRKSEFTFSGYLWAVDSLYALKYIEAEISPGANINYIKNVKIKQEFRQVNDSSFFLFKEDFYAEFNIGEKLSGFAASKSFTRKNIELNPEFPKNFFSVTVPREVITQEGASEHKPEFWKEKRYEPLRQKEEKIYGMADSVQNIKEFKRLKNIIYFAATGYYPIGKYEYGPVLQSFSQNEIEGNRFRIGGRTGNDFSQRIELGGHLAYGTKDQRLKYGVSFKYKFPKADWSILKLYHKNDMTELGKMPYAFNDGNIFSNSFSNTVNDNLFPSLSYEAGIEHQFFQGFTAELFFSHRELSPTAFYPFRTPQGKTFDKLTTGEIVFDARLAINEEYAEGVFTRLSLGTIYPMINFRFSTSIPRYPYNDYEYQKIEIDFEHNFWVGPLGWLNYRIGAGKVFGQVPYPYLALHPANETIFSEPYTFNLMNIYEFASDKYLHLFIDHHFNGLFLNKIPLLRKIKAREFISARGVVGTLSDTNRNTFVFPSGLNQARQPYIEIGIGIENILNFFQIEFVRRLSHTDNPDADSFRIMFAVIPNL